MSRDNYSGQAYGGMPKISIDPTIRCWTGRYIGQNDTAPKPPSIEHVEMAFMAVRQVLTKLAPVLKYLEVIKIRFHLGENDPNPVHLRCEVVIVEPARNEKHEVGESAIVLRTNPGFYDTIDVPVCLARLADEILEATKAQLQKCADSFATVSDAAMKFHHAFSAD